MRKTAEYSVTFQADVILPGICQYPAESAHTARKRVAPRIIFVPDRDLFSVWDVLFFCAKQ